MATFNERVSKLERQYKDINKKFCCIKSTLFFDTFELFPIIGVADTLYVDNSTGETYVWDGATYISSGGGGGSLFKQNSPTIALSGDGTELDPLIADSLLSPIDRGIIEGGIVTWISGYTYSVSPAIYYINSVRYTSPYTEITLAAADVTNNRLDAFALTNLGTAVAITGTASANPELPYINTGTQIQASFALVTANTTQPVGLQQEYIYRENVGTPTEWAATSSNAGRINVAGVLTPNNGTVDINATGVLANDTLTLTRISTFSPLLDKTVLIFYIKSKATWNNNRILNFQFRNSTTNIGLNVPFSNNTFGFNSSQTATYQRIVIPLSEFGLTPSDIIDNLHITTTGTGGTLGFLIDDMELQGATIINNYVGTTDNVGVFYVSKNYSGIGDARFSNSLYTVASITSTNAGYMQQLQAARMGDANKAYPDPWAARNAAMEAMTAGTIKKALVIINGGNTWTYGANTLSLNGDSTGNPAINETPDIKFTSYTDMSSLAKNNIDYYFNPNSTLLNLAKSVAIRIIYNVDGTDTAFTSGFYGSGNFLTPYGSAQGLSQRFMEVNNANLTFNFEANNVVANRAWGYVFNKKNITLKINRWYGDITTSVIYSGGETREGDGTPSTISVDIKHAIHGNKFSPYPLATIDTGISNSRSFIHYGGAMTNTRQKEFSFTVDNMYIESALYIYGTLVGSQGFGGGTNILTNVHIKNLKETRAATTTGNHWNNLINLNNANSNTLVFNNCIFNFRIDNGDVEAQIIDGRNVLPANASSSNNFVNLKLGNIIKKPYSVATGTSVLGGNCIIGLPITNGVITTANKPTFNIEVDNAIAVTGYCISEGIGITGYTYHGNVSIKGKFKALDGSSVVYLDNSGSAAMLKDVILVGAGTYSIDASAPTQNIYCKDVLSNLVHNVTNINQQGVLTVDTNITNYL
jgi:hypothetical protein